MRRHLAVLIGFVGAGWAFGVVDSRIPVPDSATVFWAGNLASPWLVLPFLAGWVQRSRPWALASGLAASEASMLGFFWLGGVWEPAPLGFVAPWLLVGALTGLAYGRFGESWGRSRTLLDGLALALPFVLEPWILSRGLGYAQGAVPVWYMETAVGLVLLVWVVVASRRPGSPAR
jgi:hypothetical protein